MQAHESSKEIIKLKDVLISVFTAGAFLYAGSAYSAVIPDLQTMLQNLTQAVPQLMRLVTAVAYVMGMFLVMKGILTLKQYGESRSMMSTEHSLKGPLIFIFVGAALLYLPSSVQVGLSTFWKDPAPYAYLTEDTNNSWNTFIHDIFLIIQLVGIIAFIRGLLLLTHLSSGHGQQGTFGRAMSHMIGGILLINIYQFLQVIFNTLGYGQM